MESARSTVRLIAILAAAGVAALALPAAAAVLRAAPGHVPTSPFLVVPDMQSAAPASPLRWSRAQFDDGAWSELPPPTESGGTTVLDPVRDRVLLFGGTDGRGKSNEIWALPLGAGGRWTKLTTAGTPPAPRVEHTAIYDPVGDRVVIFGGVSDTIPLNDVWALSLSGVPTWSKLAPSGALPGPRVLHAACYDSQHQRMLVFGGMFDYPGQVFNDVWALGLSGAPAWTRLTPGVPMPGPRIGTSAIFDPVRDQMVIFAGYGTAGYFQDVWALQLAGAPSWSVIGGPSPCPRSNHGALYDPGSDRMIVFGGQYFAASGCPYGFFDDVWALSLAGTPAWQQLAPSGLLPRGRAYSGICLDPSRSRMLIHGGFGYDQFGSNPVTLSPTFFLDDTWALPLTDSPAWSLLASGPLPETGRSDHTLVYDGLRDRMLAFGGSGGHLAPDGRGTLDGLSDLWTLGPGDTAQWRPLAAGGTPPPALVDAAAVMDSAGQSLLVMGGTSNGAAQDGVWRLALEGAPSWSAVSVAGTPPAARSGHTLVLDRARNRAILFGGWSAALTPLDDVWELTLGAAPAWVPVAPAGTPPAPRFGHSAIYDAVRGRVVVFGGTDGTGTRFNDLWELSFAGAPGWNPLSPGGALPPERSGHTAVWDLAGDRMVVWGGFHGSGYGTQLSDAWALALGAPAWSPLAPAGLLPGGRSDHAAVYDPARDRMLMVGGSGYDDTWSLGWGRATAPEVTCPGDVTWQAGTLLALRYAVTSHLGVAASYDWTLSSERSWPGLPLHGTLALAAGQTDSVRVQVAVPDSVAVGLNSLVLTVSLDGVPALAGQCSHHLHDATTPVLIALESVSAEAGAVEIVWWSSGAAGLTGTVTRRAGDGDAAIVARPAFDGTGRLRFTDRDVVPGGRYGYRVSVPMAGGEWTSPEVEVVVPLRPVLALRGAVPNPAAGTIVAAFSLPDAAPATLELLDIAGRRGAAREVGGLGPGLHIVRLDGTGDLAPGIYAMRLRAAAATRIVRIAVIR